MGKSKFPGKPSKLAGKKKIRILSSRETEAAPNQQQNGANAAATAVDATAAAAAANNVVSTSPNFLEQVRKKR